MEFFTLALQVLEAEYAERSVLAGQEVGVSVRSKTECALALQQFIEKQLMDHPDRIKYEPLLVAMGSRGLVDQILLASLHEFFGDGPQLNLEDLKECMDDMSNSVEKYLIKRKEGLHALVKGFLPDSTEFDGVFHTLDIAQLLYFELLWKHINEDEIGVLDLLPDLQYVEDIQILVKIVEAGTSGGVFTLAEDQCYQGVLKALKLTIRPEQGRLQDQLALVGSHLVELMEGLRGKERSDKVATVLGLQGPAVKPRLESPEPPGGGLG